MPRPNRRPRVRRPRAATPLDERPAVGLLLAEARIRAGLSQGAVGECLSVSRIFVCRVETGAAKPPKARLAAWAAAIGLDVAELEAIR